MKEKVKKKGNKREEDVIKEKKEGKNEKGKMKKGKKGRITVKKGENTR